MGEKAMTGLEKILKAIEADAQANAATVIASANKEAEDILEAAKKDAEEKCRLITEKSDADVKAVLSRAESAAALLEKKIILDTKQQIISNIITSAREKLEKLPDSEYTDIILSMIKKYAHHKEGMILFSAADKKRLTKEFPERMKGILSEMPGTSLTIADTEPALIGGFLLVYGDIEENCSFDALFAEERDILLDKVNSLLFD
jgi:V/A-type H+-transporting ATPase subunit E